MNKLLVILLVLVIALSVGALCSAGPPTDQMRAYTDQVLKVLENPALTLPERRAAVRNLAAEAFDVSETAKRALGLHWQQRTPAEREEFVKLFANLLEQTYISRIGEYGGEKIRYVDEQIDGDRATVRAKVLTRKGTEASVESRLLQRESRWLIYDVLIENISLIGSYRSQFDRIIRAASYDELVKRLKARNESNEKDANAPRATTPARR